MRGRRLSPSSSSSVPIWSSGRSQRPALPCTALRRWCLRPRSERQMAARSKRPISSRSRRAARFRSMERCLPAREPWTSRASQASRCRPRRWQEARSLPARFWPMARPSLWQKGLARIRHSAGSPSSSRRRRTRRLRQGASSTASRSTTRLSCLPLPSLSGSLPAIWSLRSRFSCSAAPGTLVVGVPVSNVAGIGNGTKHGILFKGSDAVTRFSYVYTMLFDKTGTLTYGKPKAVQGLFLGDGFEEKELAEALLASGTLISRSPGRSARQRKQRRGESPRAFSPSRRQALSGLYAASMRSRPGCAAITSSAETEWMAGSS